MVLTRRFFLLALFTLAAVSGCYTTPVRHLTADVSLLKIGTSTAEDVLVFLGSPDQKQDLGAGEERWLYKDKKMSLAEKAPLVGKYLGAPEYNQVVVTLKNDIVSNVVYSSADQDEMGWTDDFSWQDKKSD